MLESRMYYFFFFNDTATTEIYTLSLHDALPISLDDLERALDALAAEPSLRAAVLTGAGTMFVAPPGRTDRKSTRLNSSHSQNSYAVFCLKKKNTRVVMAIGVSYRHSPPDTAHVA